MHAWLVCMLLAFPVKGKMHHTHTHTHTQARDMNSLVQKILRANYAPIPSTASKDVRALIKDMLALSPTSRPSVNQVLALPLRS
jgi:hypothetical protein